MKTKLFVILLSVLSVAIKSQPCYDWAKGIGSTNYDYARKIFVDNFENVYITGAFVGTMDFDPGVGTVNLSSAGGRDVFFAKYDSIGNLLWARNVGGTYDDEGTTIKIDQSGNVYITGYFGWSFGGTADFDPGPSIVNLTSAGAMDIFFAKYDANGNYIWAKQVGSINDYEQGNDIFIDTSGNLYLTGVFRGTSDFDPSPSISNLTPSGYQDAFISKYNTNGSYLWAKNIGATSSVTSNSITLDNIGNIYITGSFEGTADLDPSPSTILFSPILGADIFFAKYDNNCNYIWAKSMGSNGHDDGKEIAVSLMGNVFVIGWCGLYGNNMDLDPGSGNTNLSIQGDMDVFVAKYNSNGDYLWGGVIGTPNRDCGYSIKIDSTENSYLTGYFKGIADFDLSNNTVNISSGISDDIFMAKYDSLSNYLWARNVGGSSSDIGYGLFLISDYIYLTGSFSGTSDFDPSVNTANLNTVGNTDIFFAKYYILPLSTSAINVSCNGGNNGAATVTPSGGIVPYTYLWNPSGQNTQTATGLSAGSFNVVVTDANGCTATASVSITQPTALAINVNVIDASSCSANDGSATANVSGGTLSYTYLWSNGGTIAAITGLAQGTYTLVVTDANGCTQTITATVNCPSSVSELSSQNVFTIFPNPNSGIFLIETKEKAYSIVITNILGEKIYSQKITSGNIEIDLSSHPNGIYFLHLKTEQGTATQKLIISR